MSLILVKYFLNFLGVSSVVDKNIADKKHLFAKGGLQTPRFFKELIESFKVSRPNKIDWCVYYMFRWWWNPILVKLPDSKTEDI